ncbi:hypothetical protein K438DRAFT_1202824, partial [Mycena galopus ATCC 62051]
PIPSPTISWCADDLQWLFQRIDNKNENGSCSGRCLWRRTRRADHRGGPPRRVACRAYRSQFVNIYILPRLAVLPGHEHKAFIPYDNIFNPPDGKPNDKHVFLHARITSLAAHSLTFARPGDTKTETLEFDYAVYVLGSHLPAPLNLWHAAPDGK